MTRPTPKHLRRIVLLALAAPLTSATSAHAGPTVSADLDLGTSTKSGPPANAIAPSGPTPSPLYTAGFGLRAGWRFDVAPAGFLPVWFLPELGGSYVVERFQGVPTALPPPDLSLGRFFAGGRIGISVALRTELQLEPSIYGHGGGGWYSQSSGSAFDVGLSLDLRIQRHFIVGAQVGYDVVTVYSRNATSPCTPTTIITAGGPVTLPCPIVSSPVLATADPWVSYGIHAGWLFW
jgi:hypothetical protein